MGRVRAAAMLVGLGVVTACGPLLGLDEPVDRIDRGTDPPVACEACDDGNPCTVDTCAVVGECVHTPIDAEAAPDQVAGDCQRVDCVAGQTSVVADGTDVPPATDCASFVCGDTGVLVAPAAPRTTCDDDDGVLCDGAGNCLECLDDDDCAPSESCGGGGVEGACGCAPATCTSLGLTCGVAHDGCASSINCNDGAQDGSESDIDCGGPEASCPARCANGRTCSEGDDCITGHCAGGACAAPWLLGFGDSAAQTVDALDVHDSGAVVVAGRMAGTVDFGGNIHVADSKTDLFVVAFDPLGAVTWSRSFAADASEEVMDVAFDTAGNVVLAGAFSGTIDFGAGAHVTAARSSYVVKLDSQGQALWSRAFPGTAPNEARALAVSDDGDVYVTGAFEGSVAFGETPLVSAGAKDVFVLRLSSAGLHELSVRFGGADEEIPAALAVEGGALALAGDFAGALSIGATDLTSAGDWDVFVAELDTDAAPVFATSFGDSAAQNARGVAIDADGEVVTVGDFTGAFSIDGHTLTSAGAQDVFVTRHTKGGDPVWAQRYGDAAGQHVAGVAIGAQGEVWIAGSFAGTIDFGLNPLVSAGGQDVFIAQLDPAGAAVWVQRAGDGQAQSVGAMAVSPYGNVVVGGAFRGAMDFGAGGVISQGGDDIFVASLSP